MEIEVSFHEEARKEYLDAIAWYLMHSELIAMRHRVSDDFNAFNHIGR